MMNYNIKLQNKDISAWKMMILFIVSVYAQDVYSMYLYFAVVVVLTMKNTISCFGVKAYAKNRYLSIFFIVALGVTTLFFVLRRISWLEEMKAISYGLILTDSLFIYVQKPKVFEKGMRMISGLIVASALYGIFEAIVSYNIFEQYFVADYIRGYYGTALYRIASIYMHPIVCGQIFLIGFWLVVYFYDKWIRTISLIVLILGIYYTKSRSIWGGLAFSIIIFGLVKVIDFFKEHKMQKKKLLYVLCTIGCIYVLYRIGIFDTIINNVCERILAARGSKSELIRQSMSMYTVNYMFCDASLFQKVFGYGLDSSKLWLDNSNVFMKAYDAIDNSYLTILYEFGLFGLLTTVCLFIRKIIRCFYKKSNTYRLNNASVMAIVACVIPLCFYDFYGWLPVYILFIYCVVSSNVPNYIRESEKR